MPAKGDVATTHPPHAEAMSARRVARLHPGLISHGVVAASPQLGG